MVSYIVPDLQKWPQWLQSEGLPPDDQDDSMDGMLRRFRTLREDVKVSLREKLPSYAVPSVIIPLQRIPLVGLDSPCLLGMKLTSCLLQTPNGKVAGLLLTSSHGV